jgi:hypothetical protein
VIATRLSAGITGEVSLAGGDDKEVAKEEARVCSMPSLYTIKFDVFRPFFSSAHFGGRFTAHPWWAKK